MSRDLPSAGLTSIIIPCWSQLEFTRQCLAALKSHTRRPWELIVVDNGSTDGTPDYLAGVSDMANVPVTVITNATNRGFPAAVNQGLKAARGEYLVLLNNDVVVTDGWLEQLIGLVNAKTGLECGREREGQRGATGASRCQCLAPSAWSGPCPTMRRRRNWSRTCPITTCERCTRLPGNGAMSIAGSGSRPTSCRGFACS